MVKAQTSNCYNGLHQGIAGKILKNFSALALFSVASDYKDNRVALGGEILYKFSVAAGSNSAGAVFTPLLEGFTGLVSTPAFALGTATDALGYGVCSILAQVPQVPIP